MNLKYKKATIEDLDILTKTRIEVLRAANKLSNDINMDEVKMMTYKYYKKALCDGTHIAYHNPNGYKAYIMNMYTNINYRRKGIAYKTLDMLIKDIKNKGITSISLEATEMGRPLYKKYGFISMNNEMELL